MPTKVAQDYLAERITWRKNTDPEYPYVADLDGERATLRINEFPAESLYTLIVDAEEIASFDDFPEHWQRP